MKTKCTPEHGKTNVQFARPIKITAFKKKYKNGLNVWGAANTITLIWSKVPLTKKR